MKSTSIGNESARKLFFLNHTLNLFFKQQSARWYFQSITVSECCLIKLLPYILVAKYIYILASANPGNQHCANSIGTLLFPIASIDDVKNSNNATISQQRATVSKKSIVRLYKTCDSAACETSLSMCTSLKCLIATREMN